MREEWGSDVTDIFARWLDLDEPSLPADAPFHVRGRLRTISSETETLDA